MTKNIYEQLSEERKQMQEAGTMPHWYTTSGWQLFKDKYLYEADTVKEQFQRIANTAARHLRHIGLEEQAKNKFFELIWKGWLSPSTPVLANTGTKRGLPVACSGSVIADSIDSFYAVEHETALLTKYGFGTSGYLGDIRPRGSAIASGGTATGILPVFKMYIQCMRDVAQGTARRGSWAGYLPMDHGDFDELVDFIMAEPDDANVGWVVTDEFIQKLNNKDADAIRRFQRTMKLKMVTGKGYYCFIDKVNANRPEMYKKHGLFVKASNLCNEVTLFSDEDHTFTCILSSMNVSLWDEWKDTDAVYWATIFLDCIAEEFIDLAKNIRGLEKAVRFTQKSRALGLGQCGFHTLLQKKGIEYEELQAQFLNREIAKHIFDQSLIASQWMAVELGEPEWCVGFGVRNSHRIAIAPTKSTALLMGGVSEGINPDPAMAFTQTTAGGAMDRLNPVLLAIMKEAKVYTKKNVKDIIDNMGSVQHVTWLTDEQKRVFKTAFEINQEVVLRLASSRSPYIDQWQSLNTFFAAEEDPAWIAHIHRLAFNDPTTLGLYYITTMAGMVGSKECVACQ